MANCIERKTSTLPCICPPVLLPLPWQNMNQGYFFRPTADNLIHVTHMALNKHTIKTTYFIFEERAGPWKSYHHITAMNPLTWFQPATPCSTSQPCPAPRIVDAEYVLCWYVTTITASYTLHNFLAAVSTCTKHRDLVKCAARYAFKRNMRRERY